MNLKRLVALFAFSLMVLALPSIASAQWGGYGRDDDYYGNSRYNRNIRGTIQNLKNRSRNFERRVEQADGRRDDRWGNRDDRWGNRGGWGNNDLGRLEQLAERFRNAAGDLADAYGNGRNLNGSRDEARRVMDYGNQIEQEMRNTRATRNLMNEWNQIRYDLRVLADVYGYGYNNNRYPNNRYPRTGSGDWRNRIPFPLPF